jgi:hypothetical protein
VDAQSFTAGADYRMYAATMTGFSGGSADTLREVVASEGTTALEADDDGGAIGTPSNIAGTALPIGTYYVRGRRFNTTSPPGTIHPYDFYLRVLSGSPIPERGPNDEGAPQAPRSNGRRSRVIGPAAAKNDSFAITVNGRDTIGVIVAVDLERGAPVWNVIAGTGKFTGAFVITLRPEAADERAAN